MLLSEIIDCCEILNTFDSHLARPVGSIFLSTWSTASGSTQWSGEEAESASLFSNFCYWSQRVLLQGFFVPMKVSFVLIVFLLLWTFLATNSETCLQRTWLPSREKVHCSCVLHRLVHQRSFIFFSSTIKIKFCHASLSVLKISSRTLEICVEMCETIWPSTRSAKKLANLNVNIVILVFFFFVYITL